MKFVQDTDGDELNLILTADDRKKELEELVEDFDSGMAWFFILFASRLHCDRKQAEGLREICVEHIGNVIDSMLQDNVLEQLEDTIKKGILAGLELDDIPEKYEELRVQFRNAGFEEELIETVIRLAEECGGPVEAMEYLDQLRCDENAE